MMWSRSTCYTLDLGPLQCKYAILSAPEIHCPDENVVSLTYLHNGISHTSQEASTYWNGPLIPEPNYTSKITCNLSILSQWLFGTYHIGYKGGWIYGFNFELSVPVTRHMATSIDYSSVFQPKSIENDFETYHQLRKHSIKFLLILRHW